MIRIKRVYDPPEPGDGIRFLVERLWPRGVRKESLTMEAWLKEAAPSDALRRWFGHDPQKWEEFRERYFAELDGRREVLRPLMEAAARGEVTLLYSARDRENNNAVALREYVEELIEGKRAGGAEPPAQCC
ncbi:MAG: DUF488 domain-containing protein [Syntrophobacteraceae bacterium]|nr:DUF488 domain-containing protein [Syntrophobacteraceae bacterium]